MFETEDLVCRKNEKHVILTLLEVARRGAKLGMLAPMLVQFEQEIDREIARYGVGEFYLDTYLVGICCKEIMLWNKETTEMAVA